MAANDATIYELIFGHLPHKASVAVRTIDIPVWETQWKS